MARKCENESNFCEISKKNVFFSLFLFQNDGVYCSFVPVCMLFVCMLFVCMLFVYLFVFSRLFVKVKNFFFPTFFVKVNFVFISYVFRENVSSKLVMLLMVIEFLVASWRVGGMVVLVDDHQLHQVRENPL